MKGEACDLHFALHNAPYNYEIATADSSSSVSSWSDTSSQHSDDSNPSSTSSDPESYDSYCFSQPDASSQSSVSSVESACQPIGKHINSKPSLSASHAQTQLPEELRQNPRRTRRVDGFRAPPLQRQEERKVNFVDNLVDSSTHIVEAIWPTSSVVARHEQGGNAVLPLRTFIQETLRRSRTSYSTLHVALYYLILIKPHVPDRDFTMEQPDDCLANQAVQCGRRMFLAALILASKYLQDRNYSARAWSKISGLQTHEINQNEITFLHAVNWKLHITDEIYNRWLDCVGKFQPPPPPDADKLAELSYEHRLYARQVYEKQCADFRAVILTLTPELDNLEALEASSPTLPHEMATRALYTPVSERGCAFGFDSEVAPSPLSRPNLPTVLEPALDTSYTPPRLAPALGLLPTPRLTPHTSGYSTPAASAASSILASKNSMGYALAEAASLSFPQDRWPPSNTASPQSYVARRSSLANSISTASSPESMVSDSSRVSRSSSISSASSVSAPSAKLDVLARCRYAKQCSDRMSLKPTIATVPEDYQLDVESLVTSTSHPYASRREQEVRDAAWALQELQSHGTRKPAAPPARSGSKRSRSSSMDDFLQDNVRDLLMGSHQESAWAESIVRWGSTAQQQQISMPTTFGGRRKRLCLSPEAAEPYMMSSLHPAMGGVGGPGMWANILS